MQPSVNNKQEYLRNVLEAMKQKMLSSSAQSDTRLQLQIQSCPRLESDFPFITSSMPPLMPLMPPMPLIEVIIGVGYVLLILVFLTKVFFKTLNHFTSDYSSSHDGAYNRFAFITNADSDSEFSTDDDIDIPSDSLSPVRQPFYTPRQPPRSPPHPLRRSKRLQMKSEMNLTTLEKHTQTQTQTQSQYNPQQKSFITISSEPLPKRQFSFVSPSPHPHHDEELAFEIQRRYEKKMQKRSECNSPLVVRRLIL